ncbi:hypothetical protein [Salinisphaera sp. G21_0]|uniref:hypothetical protein n=1 Tax=Salinisphaera sp. G21_0 TaxID=2821094 RepID=UPI001ADC5C74|nr:hypothetical protein [Salinisphaera sp. G21_0]MBO9483415.1 hypothetical protein [Salinisphaera sp. G21_0]
MRVESTETGFFSGVWKAASDDIQPDQCELCFSFSYRLVKACVVAACCPKPSEDYLAGLRKRLLPDTGQGAVAKQPSLNYMSESGSNSNTYDFVERDEAEVEGSVPFQSFQEGVPLPDPQVLKKFFQEGVPLPDSQVPEKFLADLSKPDVIVSNEQLRVEK